MLRRSFLGSAALAPVAAGAAPAAATKRVPLADDFVAVFESPDPKQIVAYSPGIWNLGDGRLVATMDRGVVENGKKKEMRKGIPADRSFWLGRIYLSTDRGHSWRHITDMPMRHARPFRAGDAIYVLGHSDDLVVMRSDDGGESWSKPETLTRGEKWHQAPCNVWIRSGRIYLVMEQVTDPNFRGWSVSVLAPVVMSAKLGDDLTRRESWTFSNRLSFVNALKQSGEPQAIGAPFYEPGSTPRGRNMAPIGWLETNIVQFDDPNHVWHDPTGHTFHLWMRAHTGATNLACIAKGVESPDRSKITVQVEHAPSGEPMLYVPCPGGQMKFHILFDERDKLFWLLSSQSTDSMTRLDRLPKNRYGLANNERHRLQLHFSTNCVDWCFAGLVADSGSALQGRHYASMAFDGDDLLILSRSGDHRARSAHDGNLITFHVVEDFRQLVY
jgi:hypothetical protein